MVKKTPLTTSSQVRKTQREEDSCYRRPLHTDWLKIQNFSDVNLSVMLSWNDELVLMFLNTKRKKQRFWFVRCSGAGGSREDFLFWSPSRSLGTGFRIELLFIRVVTTSEEAEYWFREPTDPQQQLAVNLRDAGLFTVYNFVWLELREQVWPNAVTWMVRYLFTCESWNNPAWSEKLML